jgi:hypothetical protein
MQDFAMRRDTDNKKNKFVSQRSKKRETLTNETFNENSRCGL